MKDLKERSLRAASIKIFAQGVNFLIRVGSLMILARLLDPKDFGLVGMVTAVIGVFGIFKDAGLSMVTIQRPTISNEEVSTLFWLNILVGCLLGAISLGMAPIMVGFYGEPALFWVTAALGTGFVFNAAGVQHAALLQRDLRFRTLSVVEILSQSASAILGIVMALGGYGYWALVGMTATNPIVFSACLWFTTGWVPGKPHRGVGIGSMVRFGGTTVLNGLVTYISSNLEKILVARFWGAEALGIYGKAFQLISIPSENLNGATGGVLFAGLSRLQGDTDRFKRYFLKSYSLILSLTLPSTLACALFADDIIYVILGPKWEDAVLIFRLLAPTILVVALINPMYWLMISLGMAGRSLRIALALAPLLIAATIVGLPYGPSGVAFAYSTTMLLWVVPCLTSSVHGTMISLQDLLRALGRPLISAVTAAAVAYMAQSFYWTYMASAPFTRLLLGCVILVVTYLWMILWVMGQKEFYLDLLRGLRGGLPVARTIS
jgi:O-antigen/teichoic acid export membrane protein